jgi:hypothetical protein
LGFTIGNWLFAKGGIFYSSCDVPLANVRCFSEFIDLFNCHRFRIIDLSNKHAQRNIGFKALRLVYSTPCDDAPVGRWDNLLYGTSRKYRVHFFLPYFSQNQNSKLPTPAAKPKAVGARV